MTTAKEPKPASPPTSELEFEAQLQAKGLNAPRVVPSDLDSEIVDAQFYVFPGTTVTVALLALANGFTVTGESACASVENFNATAGRQKAYENARAKLWPLLGFRLRDRLHRDSLTATPPGPVRSLAEAAGGREGNAEALIEERRRRRLADSPGLGGRIDSNANVGSTHIDYTPPGPIIPGLDVSTDPKDA